MSRIIDLIASLGKGIVTYYDEYSMIKKIKEETKSRLGLQEAVNLYNFAINAGAVDGDIAEIGTGGSARILCMVKGNKILHLFDTFDGLPKMGKIDVKYKKEQYKISLKKIKEFTAGFNNVRFHKGIFPETADEVTGRRFSFIHIDVDIYKSTKDCLEFFYPRLNNGGAILADDYVHSEGIRKAFNEYFKEAPIFTISNSQALVVKCTI